MPPDDQLSSLGVKIVIYLRKGKICEFYTEICQFLIENTQSGPAAHVEAIEEVSDPLDGASDQFYVFSVDPVGLQIKY